MGLPERLAHGALRLTMGRCTSAGDVDRLLATLPDLIARVRAVERAA